ncbi:threonine aldolase [Wenjunlia tyrosinilytica]|uniref:Threonine aldolase n=1 Tax=Wenjunlia tyrosinilytica TaxID=1544741 RepID=A0A917ZTG8_9ACTN|nr:threonine aldolase [Wenjunlia tyrosinilytica]
MGDVAPVDLRSDTVTRPTGRMLEAMASARVGDDFYGEDPTVLALEERAAELAGTEDALFVVSGTMANLVAILALVPRGRELIAEADTDLVRWESHSVAGLAGVQLTAVHGTDGMFGAADLEELLARDDWRAPQTGMVAVENTHSAGGGSVWSLDRLEEVASACRAAGVPLHCDGARLFNAAVAGGYAAHEVGALCDTVTFSLYKGLGAPMGSLLCCGAEVRTAAARARRQLGCTFRQIGTMAAAGLVALEGIEHLAEDHELAHRLARGLRDVLPEWAAPALPSTNIVTLRLGPRAAPFVAALRERGVLVTEVVPGVVRFVTHRDVDSAGVELAVAAAARVAPETLAAPLATAGERA